MRVTRDGWLFLALAGSCTVVASLTANNLLFILVAPLWSLWVLQWPLARWNLRGLAARRVLPPEIYAQTDAAGAWLLLNRGRWAARAVSVEERGGVAWPGTLEALAPSASARVPTSWCWSRRGPATLSAVVLRSSWPFGLVEGRHVIELPASVLVYPRPLPGVADARVRQSHGATEVAVPGGGGDFLGLRLAREGDPPGRAHWPTSARLGEPWVVERASECLRAVELRLRPARGEAWEREIARATGELHRALARGDAVGLSVPADGEHAAQRWPVSGGRDGRRLLLDALACLPERP